MARIMVTGACGFIGFHLSKKLCEKGFDVIGLDNLNDYYEPQLKRDRLKELHTYSNFKIEYCDMSDYTALESIFSVYGVDVVYHLAAQAGVRYSITHPKIYLESNVIGFYNLLELIRKYPVKHFLYASSSSVYGHHEGESKETDNTDHPISFYAATKKSTEILAHSYAHLYSIKMTGLRFFTVYGPWGRPDMAYYSFCEKMVKNETIDVYGEGKLLRDFTYVDDVVNEMVKLKDIVPQSYEIYNIGNHHPETVNHLVHCLEKHLKVKANIQYKEVQAGDVYQTYANIDKLHALTGFEPHTSLDKGIGEFVKWYRSYTGETDEH